MYIPGQIIAVGQAAPPSTRSALLPTGLAFLLSTVRLRCDAGVTTDAVARRFDHLGWPGGEPVLDQLLADAGRIETLPHRSCSLSTDELVLVRAAALIGLGLDGRAINVLAEWRGDAVAIHASLAELVETLHRAGLGFAMVFIPADRQQVSRAAPR